MAAFWREESAAIAQSVTTKKAARRRLHENRRRCRRLVSSRRPGPRVGRPGTAYGKPVGLWHERGVKMAAPQHLAIARCSGIAGRTCGSPPSSARGLGPGLFLFQPRRCQATAVATAQGYCTSCANCKATAGIAAQPYQMPCFARPSSHHDCLPAPGEIATLTTQFCMPGFYGAPCRTGGPVTTSRTSMTLVSVSPGLKRSPVAWKK
jgi:hypothetical protein